LLEQSGRSLRRWRLASIIEGAALIGAVLFAVLID
jgi:hypothetical protein